MTEIEFHFNVHDKRKRQTCRSPALETLQGQGLRIETKRPLSKPGSRMSQLPMPPRFVPTLTDVVQPVMAQEQRMPPASTPVAIELLEDQVLHRVMQRVDLVLERRLREAVGQVILAHTQTLGPRLREEIELVVRELVSQAVAQELSPQVP